MLTYCNPTSDVILIRQKCRCQSKREHLFTKRVKKFCFFWDDVSWYRGLTVIGLMTIYFGIAEFIMLYIIALRGSPSRIPSLLLFPFFTFLICFELLFFVTLGASLIVGVYSGNLKLIKNFPWLLLLSYPLAIIHFIDIVIDGDFIAFSLTLSDFGMSIKADKKKEKNAIFTEEIIFTVLMGICVVALILFPTYLIILALSWIEKLENEIDDEDA